MVYDGNHDYCGDDDDCDIDDNNYYNYLLLYIRLTMKNLIGREHSINSQ